MSGHIFISYGHEDWERVRRVSDRLQGLGWKVWVAPHNLRGAAEWAGEIHESVRTCRVFLLLISPNSMHSGYVLKELHVAIDTARPVVPAVLEDAQVPPSVEYLIAGHQVVDVSDLADWQLDDLAHAVTSVEQKKPRRRDRRVTRFLGNLLVGAGTVVVFVAMGLILVRMREFFSSAGRFAAFDQGGRMFEPFLLFFAGMVVAAVGQGLRRFARRR